VRESSVVVVLLRLFVDVKEVRSFLFVTAINPAVQSDDEYDVDTEQIEDYREAHVVSIHCTRLHEGSTYETVYITTLYRPTIKAGLGYA